MPKLALGAIGDEGGRAYYRWGKLRAVIPDPVVATKADSVSKLGNLRPRPSWPLTGENSRFPRIRQPAYEAFRRRYLGYPGHGVNGVVEVVHIVP